MILRRHGWLHVMLTKPPSREGRLLSRSAALTDCLVGRLEFVNSESRCVMVPHSFDLYRFRPRWFPLIAYSSSGLLIIRLLAYITATHSCFSNT